MKILIFENEFTYIETQFNYVNEVYFNNSIEFNVLQKSQDLNDYNNLNEYDFIFVDISLATKSILDGFGIIKKMENLGILKEKIVILTGNHHIKQGLKEKGLQTDYRILTKPIDFTDLLSVFNVK